MLMNNQVHREEIVILGAGYGGLHVAQRLSSLLRDVPSGGGTPPGSCWSTATRAIS